MASMPVIPINAKIIPLSHGRYVIVDADAYSHLSKFKWRFHNGYAVRQHYMGIIEGKPIYWNMQMHRIITNCSSKYEVDHINGNRLDNRITNLRFCNDKQNAHNSMNRGGSSKYKGVHWDKRKRRWIAQIGIEWKRIHLGNFLSEEQAAAAYNQAAIKYHGEFASFNAVHAFANRMNAR